MLQQSCSHTYNKPRNAHWPLSLTLLLQCNKRSKTQEKMPARFVKNSALALVLHQRRMWGENISLHFGSLPFPGSNSMAQGGDRAYTNVCCWVGQFCQHPLLDLPGYSKEPQELHLTSVCPRDKLGKCVSTPSLSHWSRVAHIRKEVPEIAYFKSGAEPQAMISEKSYGRKLGVHGYSKSP